MLARHRWLLAVILLVTGAGLIAQVAVARRANASSSESTSAPARTRAAGQRPNIVFILTDDLSLDLLPYMPHVQELERRGLSFSDYFVSDSLCCPSRSSILTGNLPHDTGVFNNVGKDGGFLAFHRRGEEEQTFAVALHRAGYRTALMGKYLNGYLDVPEVPDTYVPPGWSEWDAGGWGYNEYGYNLNQNGVVRHYGHQPWEYLTYVLAELGVGFIQQSAAEGAPFFLELSTYAPHSPYVPAPQDVDSFAGLAAPRPPSFNTLPTDPPRWLAAHDPLDESQIDQIDETFRRRVQSVQSVDRVVGWVEDELAAAGVAGNTYLVFSSDNGLHAGQYRLMPGKMTAYDTDIHVPLIVVGPGVPAGATTSAIAENIDLAETFAAIGGTQVDGDGHSLMPLLSGTTPDDWRTAAVVEHHGPDLRGDDPDFQQPPSGSPRSYTAIRTRGLLYVEYTDGERELYDLRSDPFELDNLAGRLPGAALTSLHDAVVAIESCHDGRACWQAMSLRLDLGHALARAAGVTAWATSARPKLRLPRALT